MRARENVILVPSAGKIKPVQNAGKNATGTKCRYKSRDT